MNTDPLKNTVIASFCPLNDFGTFFRKSTKCSQELEWFFNLDSRLRGNDENEGQISAYADDGKINIPSYDYDWYL